MDITNLNINFYNLQNELRRFTPGKPLLLDNLLDAVNALFFDLQSAFPDIHQAAVSSYPEVSGSMWSIAALLTDLYKSHEPKFRELRMEALPANFDAVKKEIRETKIQLLEQEGQMENLRQAKAELEAHLTQKKKNLASIKTQEHEIRNLNNALKQTIGLIETAELPELQQQQTALSKKKTDLEQRKTELTGAIRDTEQQIRDAESDCTARDSECTRLSSDLEQCRQRLAAAQALQKQLEERLCQSRADTDAAGKRSEELTTQITENTSRLDALNTQIDQQLTELDSVNGSIDSRTRDSADLSELLAAARKTLAEEQAEIDTIQTQIDAASAEAVEKRRILAEKQDEHNRLIAELDTLNESIAAEDTAIAELHTKIESAKVTYDEKHAQFSALAEALGEILDKIKALENEIRYLTEQRLLRQRDVDSLLAEKDHLEQQIAELEQALEQLRRKLEEARNIIAELRYCIDRTESELTQCNNHIRELDAQYHALCEELERLRLIEAELSEKVRAALEKKAHLKKIIAEYELVLQELANIADEIAAAEASLADARARQAQAAAARDDLLQKIRQTEAAIEILRRECAELEPQLHEAEQTRLALAAKRDELAEKLKTSQAQAEALKQEAAELSRKLAESEAAAVDFRKRITELNDQIAAAESEREALLDQVFVLEQELAYQLQSNEKYRLDPLKTTADKLEAAKAEYAELVKEVEELEKTLEGKVEARNEIDKKKDDLAQQNRALESSLEIANRKFDTKSREYDTEKRELAQIEKKIEEKIKGITELAAKKEKAKALYESLDPVAVRAQYNQDIADLEEEIRQVKKMLADQPRVDAELAANQAEYNSIKTKRDTAQQESEKLKKKLAFLLDEKTQAEANALDERIKLMEGICEHLRKHSGGFGPAFNLDEAMQEQLTAAHDTLNALTDAVSRYQSVLKTTIPAKN